MLGNITGELGASASIDTTQKGEVGLAFRNSYHFEAFDSNGNLKWEETINNIVVNVGLDDVLNKYYKGSAYTAAHYVGLVSGTPTVAATDTMSSHVGWTEIVAYSEAARQTLVLGAVASQSVDNSASKASFSINGTATVGGGFVATDATKSGTTGILVGAAAFTGGNKSLTSGDTINVTITLTAATV